jgi:hypothetical protein
MIFFTADTDWASEEVLNFFFDAISKFDARWLIFATNNNDRFAELESEGHEIGIHPNYIPCESRKAMEQEVFRMKNLFPDSRFSRSHSLLTGGPIWDSLQKNEISHDFSYFQPTRLSPENRILWNGLIQIGYNWEDDYHFHVKDFNEKHNLELLTCRNLIVNFHPIHFYLNTISKQDYLFYLENKNNPPKIEQFRKKNWQDKSGCGKLLLSLLKNREDFVRTSLRRHIESMTYQSYPWKKIWCNKYNFQRRPLQFENRLKLKTRMNESFPKLITKSQCQSYIEIA